MRTWAFIVIVAAALVPGCGGDNNNNPGQDGGITSPPPGAHCTQADCDDGNPCNGAESCRDDGKCVAGTPAADGTDCGGGNVCHAGVGGASLCGNGKVDSGEDCDGGPDCTAKCQFLCTDSPATQCVGSGVGTPDACNTYVCNADHTCAIGPDTAKNAVACGGAGDMTVCANGACVAAGCGNGVREPGEECDDGNFANLDGCDNNCLMEQAARITELDQQFAPDAFCTKDALGTAITEIAQPIIQGTWDQPIGDGSMSIVFKFIGLPSALAPDTVSDFTLGFIDPNRSAPPVGVTYDGTKDLDWWYTADPASVDFQTDNPNILLPAHIDHGHITTPTPGPITVRLRFALEPADVTLFNTVVDAQLSPTLDTPLISTTGLPPGHLPSENLDPDLKTFSTSSSGQMCSDVSVLSLFRAPMPPDLIITCLNPDFTPEFTPDNTLLDAFVAGCSISGQLAIQPTQPDGSRDHATYKFKVDEPTHSVVGCTRNGAPAELVDCLKQTTFSSSFKFQSDRVIIHRFSPPSP